MLVVVVVTAVTTPLVYSQEPVIEAGAGLDIVSHYIWRGQLLTDDPVMQPYVEFGAHGFTLNAWGSVDMTDINEDGGEDFRFQEIDYTLSYAMSPADALDLEGGLIYYDFPGTGLAETAEEYLSAALPKLPLSPHATVYYDFDEVQGIYANFGCGHTVPLADKVDLNLEAGLGWGDEDYNNAYFGSTDSGLNDLALTATLDYEFSQRVSVAAYVTYSELLDSDIEEAVADSDILSGGIGFYFNY